MDVKYCDVCGKKLEGKHIEVDLNFWEGTIKVNKFVKALSFIFLPLTEQVFRNEREINLEVCNKECLSNFILKYVK